MIQLIMNLAMFFLVPFILLPCFVIIAMSLSGMIRTYQEYNPSGLENRRARNASELAAINISLRPSSSDVPCNTRREKTPHRVPSHTTPQHS
jgi:hypothetical protein